MELFHFPTIGDGVTIEAETLEEALRIAGGLAKAPAVEPPIEGEE